MHTCRSWRPGGVTCLKRENISSVKTKNDSILSCANSYRCWKCQTQPRSSYLCLHPGYICPAWLTVLSLSRWGRWALSPTDQLVVKNQFSWQEISQMPTEVLGLADIFSTLLSTAWQHCLPWKSGDLSSAIMLCQLPLSLQVVESKECWLNMQKIYPPPVSLPLPSIFPSQLPLFPFLYEWDPGTYWAWDSRSASCPLIW